MFDFFTKVDSQNVVSILWKWIACGLCGLLLTCQMLPNQWLVSLPSYSETQESNNRLSESAMELGELAEASLSRSKTRLRPLGQVLPVSPAPILFDNSLATAQGCLARVLAPFELIASFPLAPIPPPSLAFSR